MTLEEVGQMIADAPKGCRDAVTFWRMKAKRKLDHIALCRSTGRRKRRKFYEAG